MKRKVLTAASLITVLVAIGVLCIPGLPFGYNDDSMLQSILRGNFAGVADYHTVYVAAPLSILLRGLYALLPDVPWFGLFLLSSYLLCLFLCLRRVGLQAGQYPWMAILTAVFFFAAFVFPQMLSVHYTLAAGCVMATGIFLLYGKDVKPYNIALFLFWLGYEIRSQVFFLALPFVLLMIVAQEGKYRFTRVLNPEQEQDPDAETAKEKNLREKHERRSKTGRVVFTGLILGSIFWQTFLYQSDEWREYQRYNDARTEVYDYTGVWDTDEALAYYESIGIGDKEYPVYANYDLLLDPMADVDRLEAMAGYTDPLSKQSLSVTEHAKDVIYTLKWKITEDGDGAKFLFLILCGVMTFIFLWLENDRLSAIGVVCALAGWAMEYGFLIWRGRFPERVTLPLYLITYAYMLGSLFCARSRRKGFERRDLIFAVLSVTSAVWIYNGFGEALWRKISVNDRDDMVYSYIRSHPENVYFLETYTVMERTGDVLSAEGIPENAMPLGGWMTGSPNVGFFMEKHGYTDAATAMLTSPEVYYLCREDVGLSIDELETFLDCKMQQTDVLNSEGVLFGVYQCIQP